MYYQFLPHDGNICWINYAINICLLKGIVFMMHNKSSLFTLMIDWKENNILNFFLNGERSGEHDTSMSGHAVHFHLVCGFYIQKGIYPPSCHITDQQQARWKAGYNSFQKMKVYLCVFFLRGSGTYVIALVSIVGVQGFKMYISFFIILLNVSVEIMHTIRRHWLRSHTLGNSSYLEFSQLLKWRQ